MNYYSEIDHNDFPAISGKRVVALMRSARVTIRKMAEVNDITLKRVREIRENGAASGFASWEVHWMIEESRSYN